MRAVCFLPALPVFFPAGPLLIFRAGVLVWFGSGYARVFPFLFLSSSLPVFFPGPLIIRAAGQKVNVDAFSVNQPLPPRVRGFHLFVSLTACCAADCAAFPLPLADAAKFGDWAYLADLINLPKIWRLGP